MFIPVYLNTDDFLNIARYRGISAATYNARIRYKAELYLFKTQNKGCSGK